LKVVAGIMMTTFQEHAGVEGQSTGDSRANSCLDGWIALLGIVAILMAYTVREVLTHLDTVQVVTNRA
jgi:hypothetical protein